MRIHHIAELAGAPRSRVARSFAPIALLVCALLPATTIGEQPRVAGEPEPSTGAAARHDLSLDGLMPGAKMTAGFGPRRHPFEDRIAHHDGVDLSTGEESPVYVPRGGRIEVAEEDYGSEGKFGTVVIVDHGGGVKTFYAHLARLSVQAAMFAGSTFSPSFQISK